MTARKPATKKITLKGSSMSGKARSGKIVVRRAKAAAKKAKVRTSSNARGVVALLETLEKLGARPIRSAKSVEEVSFGRIYADGVYNAD